MSRNIAGEADPKSVIPIHAFEDNYVWLLRAGRSAWVVDPGEPFGVMDYLDHHGVTLTGILLTHHHDDHTGGVEQLRHFTGAKVYGPKGERLPQPVSLLAEGDLMNVLCATFIVLAVPGHTAGHIAYYTPDFNGAPLLFCGDTLFSGGCGRLFEGTPAQMLASLDRLAGLPPATLVCCAHEYTVGNLRFAREVEPDNMDVAARLHRCEVLVASGEPTLPSTIERELKINPFLRTRLPSVIDAVSRVDPDARDEVSVFAALRAWKNGFR
jgi:hydroxyacylglutathione hydrolase